MNELLARIWSSVTGYLSKIFEHVNWLTIGVFLTGFAVSVFILFKYVSKKIAAYETRASDQFTRQKSGNRKFSTLSLKNEYKAGLFLLAGLNVVLLAVNIIDVRYVWFSLEWLGGYAKVKQFVHQGTYLLIISILLAAGVILFFFRGNLNFYTNKPLRYLSIGWMLQNAVLAISVCIRNVHYINNFSLAYKRIAVFAFLLLILVGVASVIWKVVHRKTFYWILRINMLALMIVLLSGTFIDWSKVTAQYNLHHYKNSFVHFGYLVKLPDKCLPILDKSKEELAEIKNYQDTLFPFNYRYMKEDEYYDRIATRKTDFINEWQKRSWLSWNLADQQAYNALTHSPE